MTMAHSINALEIHVVKRGHAPHKLFMKCVVMQISLVTIPGKEFVCAFTCQDNFHMLRSQPRREVAWNSASHEIDIEGLEIKDDGRKRLDDLLGGENVLVMNRPEMACHSTGGFEIRGAL